MKSYLYILIQEINEICCIFFCSSLLTAVGWGFKLLKKYWIKINAVFW